MLVHPEIEFLVLNDMLYEQQKKMIPNQRSWDTLRLYAYL
jgi:hypothetical protein